MSGAQVVLIVFTADNCKLGKPHSHKSKTIWMADQKGNATRGRNAPTIPVSATARSWGGVIHPSAATKRDLS